MRSLSLESLEDRNLLHGGSLLGSVLSTSSAPVAPAPTPQTSPLAPIVSAVSAPTSSSSVLAVAPILRSVASVPATLVALAPSTSSVPVPTVVITPTTSANTADVGPGTSSTSSTLSLDPVSSSGADTLESVIATVASATAGVVPSQDAGSGQTSVASAVPLAPGQPVSSADTLDSVIATVAAATTSVAPPSNPVAASDPTHASVDAAPPLDTAPMGNPVTDVVAPGQPLNLAPVVNPVLDTLAASTTDVAATATVASSVAPTSVPDPGLSGALDPGQVITPVVQNLTDSTADGVPADPVVSAVEPVAALAPVVSAVDTPAPLDLGQSAGPITSVDPVTAPAPAVPVSLDLSQVVTPITDVVSNVVAVAEPQVASTPAPDLAPLGSSPTDILSTVAAPLDAATTPAVAELTPLVAPVVSVTDSVVSEVLPTNDSMTGQQSSSGLPILQTVDSPATTTSDPTRGAVSTGLSSLDLSQVLTEVSAVPAEVVDALATVGGNVLSAVPATLNGGDPLSPTNALSQTTSAPLSLVSDVLPDVLPLLGEQPLSVDAAVGLSLGGVVQTDLSVGATLGSQDGLSVQTQAETEAALPVVPLLDVATGVSGAVELGSGSQPASTPTVSTSNEGTGPGIALQTGTTGDLGGLLNGLLPGNSSQGNSNSTSGLDLQVGLGLGSPGGTTTDSPGPANAGGLLGSVDLGLELGSTESPATSPITSTSNNSEGIGVGLQVGVAGGLDGLVGSVLGSDSSQDSSGVNLSVGVGLGSSSQTPGSPAGTVNDGGLLGSIDLGLSLGSRDSSTTTPVTPVSNAGEGTGIGLQVGVGGDPAGLVGSLPGTGNNQDSSGENLSVGLGSSAVTLGTGSSADSGKLLNNGGGDHDTLPVGLNSGSAGTASALAGFALAGSESSAASPAVADKVPESVASVALGSLVQQTNPELLLAVDPARFHSDLANDLVSHVGSEQALSPNAGDVFWQGDPLAGPSLWGAGTGQEEDSMATALATLPHNGERLLKLSGPATYSLPGGAQEESPDLQGADLLTGSVPFDARSLDGALQQLVGQLQTLGKDFSRLLASLHYSHWFLAVALLAVTCELSRRRLGRARTQLILAGSAGKTSTWLPGLASPEDED